MRAWPMAVLTRSTPSIGSMTRCNNKQITLRSSLLLAGMRVHGSVLLGNVSIDFATVIRAPLLSSPSLDFAYHQRMFFTDAGPASCCRYLYRMAQALSISGLSSKPRITGNSGISSLRDIAGDAEIDHEVEVEVRVCDRHHGDNQRLEHRRRLSATSTRFKPPCPMRDRYYQGGSI